MLWTIFVILPILWLPAGHRTRSKLIHILLVIAVVILLNRLLRAGAS
jgi:hypothetical protein